MAAYTGDEMNTLFRIPRAARPALPISLSVMVPLAIALATPWTNVAAATRTVTTCTDGGFGSLRDAIQRLAVSGDTIDMSGLTCSRIVLTRGQIQIPQNDLTLVGPGRFGLTIDGAGATQMLWHDGTGTLRIRGLSIANGFFADPAADGACIHSRGSVELERSRVFRCQAHARYALEPGASGGAVYAWIQVSLSRSSVFDSFATNSGGGIQSPRVVLYRSQVYGNEATDGGGIASGDITATYSLIHGNIAGRGGGIAGRDMTINKSTISNNVARFGSGGGILASFSDQRRLIIDSTISGNTADSESAADFSGRETLIVNSTIVMNHDVRGPTAQPCVGALEGGPGTLRLENTIVALTTCNNGPAYDIGGSSLFPYPVVGSNNLIGSSVMALPGDTISADPRIAPLADNGGPTRTHMLLADSPAINRGHNNFNREYDQRGPGFPREKGAFPDMGAIER